MVISSSSSLHAVLSRLPRRWIVFNCLVATFLFSIILYWSNFSYSGYSSLKETAAPRNPLLSHSSTDPKPLSCSKLPGADDVLVVMKTGVTAIHQRLPVHFKTTFRCTPNYAIFSDLEEDFEGHHIFDALDDTDPTILNSSDQFLLYRNLQAYKAPVVDHEAIVNSTDGRDAWNLDKWKFLPLMHKSWNAKPDAKWFIFIEADTYLTWSNLLRWLGRLDSGRPYYLGAQTYMGDTIFAHGGSGFVLSNAALRMVLDHMEGRMQEYNDLTAREWAGDAVLATVLKNAGVDLTFSWPMIQGHTPYNMDYNQAHWCRPVVTYHHVAEHEIEDMFDMEQAWLAQGAAVPPILHRDVFKQLIEPAISDERLNWDNISNDQLLEGQTLETCRQNCQNLPACLQYTFTDGRDCHLSAVARLGKAMDPGNPLNPDTPLAVSGWMSHKIKQFQEQLSDCTVEWVE